MQPERDEELHTGSPRPVPLGLVVALVAVLVVGGALGYALGHRTRGAAAPPTTRTRTVTDVPAVEPTPPGIFQAIDTTGHQCSAMVNGKLQLGIEVTNHTENRLRLVQLSPVLPLGGLAMLDRGGVGSCGQLDPTAINGYLFAPDTTIWLSATFDVRVRCPSFVPVSFHLSYQRGGEERTARLAGFSDLGNVPYPCPSSSSS